MSSVLVQSPEILPEIYNGQIRFAQGYEVHAEMMRGTFAAKFVVIANFFRDLFSFDERWIYLKAKEGQKESHVYLLQKTSKITNDLNDSSRLEVVKRKYLYSVSKGFFKQNGKKCFLLQGESKEECFKVKVKDAKEKSLRPFGTSKTIKKAAKESDGSEIACLVSRKQKDVQASEHEVEVFQRLGLECKGIVQFLGCIKDDAKIRFYIFEELFDCDLLKFNFSQLEIRHIDSIANDLIHGLAVMHEKKVSHNDVKAGNILIKKLAGDTYAAAFCDFGFASLEDLDARADKGTLLWLSPEKARCMNTQSGEGGTPFTKEQEYKADVWALGLELYRLYNQGYPQFFQENDSFFTQNPRGMIKLLTKLQELQNKSPQELDELIMIKPFEETSRDHLIWEMLQVDPNKRPSMAEVKKRWEALPKEQ